MKELVRIGNTDIKGHKDVWYGLTSIHGVGSSFSSAVCNLLNIERTKKIGDLSPEDVKRIEDVLKQPKELPSFLYNRRRDPETGDDAHLLSSNLKLRIEFDVKRMKRLRTYKGVRHGLGLPVRGQRTKSHFRTGSTVGVMKKAAKAMAAAKAAEQKKEK